MVVVAQLVRVPDCGSGGRRFEPDLPPRQNESRRFSDFFFEKIKEELLSICLKAQQKIYG